MVAVSSDELSPMITGIIYCSVISACRAACAMDRAHEWTEALAVWCERQPDLVAYAGQCRVHRAAVLRFRGAWQRALDEATRAAEDAAATGDPDGVLGAARYEEGESRRLRGELAAADEAFRAASRLGREPLPGLALLRLAQGDTEGAATSISRAVAEKIDPLARARLLPAHVRIMLAAGRINEAAAASHELDALAGAVGTEYLGAAANHARGAVRLAEGDEGAACQSLRAACHAWRSLHAPYETARSHELLGHACHRLGDDEAAALELEAARSLYAELGAATDLSRLDPARSGRTHGLTRREREVLAHVATGQTNRAIASELFISEKTVARHVSNIFSKLGLSTRAGATAYAYEHDLLRPPT
jgi:DNA-binding NarL/FixJ family response regulator